jgi:four helix bundle protein
MSEPIFDHEKLDVYRVSITFVAWTGDLLAGPLSGCSLSAVKQLDRASTSIPLNIAEGNGKRSTKDRSRYLDTSRGSALESAACLDVLVARRVLQSPQINEGKALLVRVVGMLAKMVERLSEVADTRML